jgi:hypothetical protein
MAFFGLDLFIGGCITAIPVVTGIAQGVSHQKKMNAEAANETRMVKCYLDVFCETTCAKANEIKDCTVILKHDKVCCSQSSKLLSHLTLCQVWLTPKDLETGRPKPLKDGSVPHPFTGFYFMYPDEERSPPERGLVSTISDDPPMLNWIYVNKDSFELRYGNRTQSLEHVVGPWDWTEDEAGVTLEGWEGFVAVEEDETPDGLKWALYYDRWDDDFGTGRKVNGRNRLQCSLERRILPDELRKQQEAEADKKMQVKSEGNIGSTWG